MIDENIKRIRKSKGISQEELAVGLHVVRQTVSKWEQGRSVPDAEAVIRMAELLNVSVNEILGDKIDDPRKDLTAELAKANELLAEKSRQERMVILANKKRGLLLLLSFAALIFALIFRDQLISICLIGICLIAAIFILYRNLALLTSITTGDLKIKALKVTTIFDAIIILIGLALAIMVELRSVDISEQCESLIAAVLFVCVIIFSGIVSPKLPFSKHTGLRLPWTVQDKDTWNVAHKVIGYTALPISLLFIAGALTIDNLEAVVIVTTAVWIGLPAIISLIYYYRKTRGKV